MKNILLCCIPALVSGCVSIQMIMPTSQESIWISDTAASIKPSVCIKSNSFSRDESEHLKKCLRKTDNFSKILIGDNNSCDIDIYCYKWNYTPGPDPDTRSFWTQRLILLPSGKNSAEYSMFIHQNGKIYSSVGLLIRRRRIGIIPLFSHIRSSIRNIYNPDPEPLFTSMLIDLKNQGAFDDVSLDKSPTEDTGQTPSSSLQSNIPKADIQYIQNIDIIGE